MKYKKIILLVIGILLVTTLGACSNKNKSDNNKKISNSITQSSHIKKQDSLDINNSSINNNSQIQNSNIQNSITLNNSSNDNQSSIIFNNSNNVSQSSITSNDNISTNKSKNINLTVQQLGTLVCLYNRPAWFNTYINNLWYGTINNDANHNYTNNLAGYHYITANGDPTSWLYYKQVGNNVILKYINPNVTPVYKAPIVQQVVPMSTLINSYYNNSSQQTQVNNYANKLKPYNINKFI